MSTLMLAVGTRDHVRGSEDAPVTLVEYGDFECPYCGRAFQELKEIEARLGPQVRFVFRHFPLTRVHPHAEAAALAAESAGAQGSFWPMHRLLFESQDALEDIRLWEYAGTLGLHLEAFERDMRTRRFLQRIQEDLRSGLRSGVNGTPTFFINGERYDGLYDAAELIPALQRAAAPHPAR